MENGSTRELRSLLNSLAQLFFLFQDSAIRVTYIPTRRSFMTFPHIYFLGLLSSGYVSVVWGFSVLFFFSLCLGSSSEFRIMQHAGISFTRVLMSTRCAFSILTELEMSWYTVNSWISRWMSINDNIVGRLWWTSCLPDNIILSCEFKLTEIILRKLVSAHRAVFSCTSSVYISTLEMFFRLSFLILTKSML